MWSRPTPTIAELRRKLGRGVSDDDLILRTIVGDDAVQVAGPPTMPRDDLRIDRPLVQFIRELTEQNGKRFISLQKGDLSLKVQKA